MTISCHTCNVYRLLPAPPEMSHQDTEQQFDMITALLGMCECNVMVIVYTHGDIAIKLALSVQLMILLNTCTADMRLCLIVYTSVS